MTFPLIERIRPSQWRALRAAQSRMLADSPAAFDLRPGRVANWRGADWAAWCSELAGSPLEAAWVAGPRRRPVAVIVAALVVENGVFAAGFGWLWVEPRWRCSGIGTDLVRTVEDWACDAGAERCWLWVAETNDVARRLYARLGYRPSGLWSVTSHPGRGEERWEKPLPSAR